MLLEAQWDAFLISVSRDSLIQTEHAPRRRSLMQLQSRQCLFFRTAPIAIVEVINPCWQHAKPWWYRGIQLCEDKDELSWSMEATWLLLLFFRTSLLHKLRRWPEGSNTLRQVKYIQFQEFQVHSTRFLFVWRCREFLSGFLTDFLSRVYVWSKWSSNVPRRCSTSPVRCRPGTTAARFAFEHCTISIRNAKKRYDTNTYVRMEKVRIEQYWTSSICSSVLLHEVAGRFWMYDNFANLLIDFKWFIVDVAASTLKVCTKEMPGTSGGLQGFIVLLAWSLDDSTFMDSRCRRLPCFIVFHHVSSCFGFGQVYNRHLWNVTRAERFAQAFQVWFAESKLEENRIKR